eukprot:3136856-Pleurochrysis_carterae.AAC.1
MEKERERERGTARERGSFAGKRKNRREGACVNAFVRELWTARWLCGPHQGESETCADGSALQQTELRQVDTRRQSDAGKERAGLHSVAAHVRCAQRPSVSLPVKRDGAVSTESLRVGRGASSEIEASDAQTVHFLTIDEL